MSFMTTSANRRGRRDAKCSPTVDSLFPLQRHARPTAPDHHEARGFGGVRGRFGARRSAWAAGRTRRCCDSASGANSRRHRARRYGCRAARRSSWSLAGRLRATRDLSPALRPSQLARPRLRLQLACLTDGSKGEGDRGAGGDLGAEEVRELGEPRATAWGRSRRPRNPPARAAARSGGRRWCERRLDLGVVVADLDGQARGPLVPGHHEVDQIARKRPASRARMSNATSAERALRTSNPSILRPMARTANLVLLRHLRPELGPFVYLAVRKTLAWGRGSVRERPLRAYFQPSKSDASPLARAQNPWISSDHPRGQSC